MSFEWRYLEKNLQKDKLMGLFFLIFFFLVSHFVFVFVFLSLVVFCSCNSHEGVKCKKENLICENSRKRILMSTLGFSITLLQSAQKQNS